jgi:hypothetical protein
MITPCQHIICTVETIVGNKHRKNEMYMHHKTRNVVKGEKFKRGNLPLNSIVDLMRYAM